MPDITIPQGAFEAAKAGSNPKAAQPTPKEALSKTPPGPPAEPAPDLKSNPDKPVSEMTAAEKKIWKIKAAGREVEVDASDEDNLKRLVQKAYGADQIFEESAAMRKQAETFFSMLKDPSQLEKLLTDPRIGVDVKKWAEDYVWKQIEESQLTPEQKSQRDRDREYERLKRKEENENLTKAEQEKRERQAGYESQYEKTILKALEIKGVPKDQFTVMKMADYMIAAVKKGYDLSADEIADLVKQDNANYFKAHTSEMNEEQFLEFLGEQAAEKLRKADLKRLKSPTANPFPESYQKSKKKPLDPKKQTGSDWRKATIDAFIASQK